MRKVVLLTAAMTLMSMPALADSPYLQADIGGSFIIDPDIKGEGLSGSASLDNAFLFGGAAGYRFLDNLRAEVNVSYRRADIDSVTIAGTSLDGAGNTSALTFMGNVYYDFHLHTDQTSLVPYLGAGIGGARIKVDSDRGADFRVDDRDTVFAWNLMAGASYPVTDQVDLALGYRYLQTSDPKFDATLLDESGEMRGEFRTHEVVASLRFNF